MRQLLQEYVCARIPELKGIDIGLFDFDGMNTIYFFVLNADEQIYLRYGGGENSERNANRPLDEFLSDESFVDALIKGLEQHELYKEGKLPRKPRPAPRFPREIRSIKVDWIDRGKCFHCHFVRHYDWGDRDALGQFDKLKESWAYPELTKIGIDLAADPPLVLKSVGGIVNEAGMKAGDKIVAINDQSVLTYGDLHYLYDKIPYEATMVQFTVERGDSRKVIDIPLPRNWRVTGVNNGVWRFRVNPGFGAVTLKSDEQERLGLKVGGFSSRVRTVRRAGKEMLAGGKAGLEPGDVIYAVDSAEVDEYGQNLYTYIKLRKKVGKTIRLKVLRDGRKLEISYKLEAEPHTKWADALRASGG